MKSNTEYRNVFIGLCKSNDSIWEFQVLNKVHRITYPTICKLYINFMPCIVDEFGGRFVSHKLHYARGQRKTYTQYSAVPFMFPGVLSKFSQNCGNIRGILKT